MTQWQLVSRPGSAPCFRGRPPRTRAPLQWEGSCGWLARGRSPRAQRRSRVVVMRHCGAGNSAPGSVGARGRPARHTAGAHSGWRRRARRVAGAGTRPRSCSSLSAWRAAAAAGAGRGTQRRAKPRGATGRCDRAMLGQLRRAQQKRLLAGLGVGRWLAGYLGTSTATHKMALVACWVDRS